MIVITHLAKTACQSACFIFAKRKTQCCNIIRQCGRLCRLIYLACHEQLKEYKTSLEASVCVCRGRCVKCRCKQCSIWGLHIWSDYVGGGPLAAANQAMTDDIKKYVLLTVHSKWDVHGFVTFFLNYLFTCAKNILCVDFNVCRTGADVDRGLL